MEWYLKALKGFSEFRTRARRKEYWIFVGINMLGIIILGIIIDSTQISEKWIEVFKAALFIPTLAVGVRRMHDIGHSGWWLLVPIYNLVLLLREGDREANKYGPNPKQAEIAY